MFGFAREGDFTKITITFTHAAGRRDRMAAYELVLTFVFFGGVPP